MKKKTIFQTKKLIDKKRSETLLKVLDNVSNEYPVTREFRIH